MMLSFASRASVRMTSTSGASSNWTRGRISPAGSAAALAWQLGGVGRACPTPESVGAATPRNRHFGQRPSGALAGMTAPQFGHWLAGRWFFHYICFLTQPQEDVTGNL